MLKSMFAVIAAALLLAACDEPPVAAPPPPPPQAAPSYMVFFDWDRSNLSPVYEDDQAAPPTRPAAARITATGRTYVWPGKLQYGAVARRANSVKEGWLRKVPGCINHRSGEAGLLVQTGDGVREPQNCRVEIVIAGWLPGRQVLL